MTTYYFVLMIMFNGSNGYVEAPAKYGSLEQCRTEAAQNALMLRAKIKWRCDKRAQKL